MKKCIISFAFMAVLSLCAMAQQKNPVSISHRGDTVEIVDDAGDTTRITSTSITTLLNKVLDDTLNQGSTYYDLTKSGDSDNAIDLATSIGKKFEWIPILAIVFIFGGPILLIILIVLIIVAYRLKVKRDRNRIIEKAIDAGYNLPDEFVTGRPKYYVGQRPLNSQHAQQANGAKTEEPKTVYVNGAPAAAYTPAVKQSVIALGIAIAFWAIGLQFLAGIALIFVLLGVWKAYQIYVDSKNCDIFMRPMPPSQEEQAQSAEQPAEPAAPVHEPNPESEYKPKEN